MKSFFIFFFIFSQYRISVRQLIIYFINLLFIFFLILTKAHYGCLLPWNAGSYGNKILSPPKKPWMLQYHSLRYRALISQFLVQFPVCFYGWPYNIMKLHLYATYILNCQLKGLYPYFSNHCNSQACLQFQNILTAFLSMNLKPSHLQEHISQQAK